MRRFKTMLVAISAVMGIHTTALAAYPEHPVTLIVPQAPGGASDALARILAQKLSEKWKQPVVVENRAGAGGSIGLAHVSKSKGDGYTLLMSYEGTQAINASLYSDLSYDSVNDFVPVATVATVPFVCVINNNVKATTFKEFVALAKSGKTITFGSAGNGSVNHLLGEMVNMTAKTHLTHVPYKGAGPALGDLLGGRITAVFTSLPSIKQQIDSGTVRALAVTSAKRSKELPSVPTIAESGYADFNVDPWFGLFAPKGTPTELVNRINKDVGTILDEADIVKSFSAQGAVPFKSQPDDFKNMLDRDIKKWAVVVKESGAKVN